MRHNTTTLDSGCISQSFFHHRFLQHCLCWSVYVWPRNRNTQSCILVHVVLVYRKRFPRLDYNHTISLSSYNAKHSDDFVSLSVGNRHSQENLVAHSLTKWTNHCHSLLRNSGHCPVKTVCGWWQGCASDAVSLRLSSHSDLAFVGNCNGRKISYRHLDQWHEKATKKYHKMRNYCVKNMTQKFSVGRATL